MDLLDASISIVYCTQQFHVRYLGHGHHRQHQAQCQHDGETELRVTLQTIAAIAGMVMWDSIIVVTLV